MRYLLEPNLSFEEKFEEIISEYYKEYNKRGKPHLYSELLGKKCNEIVNEAEHLQCCALDCDFFKKIACPLLADYNIVSKFIEEKRCFCAKKVTWEQDLRLGLREYKSNYHNNFCCPLKEIEICKLLIISYFTSQYIESPESFDKLLQILLCELNLEYRIENYEQLDVIQNDVEILENHLRGNLQGTENTPWVILLDQSIALCRKSNVDVEFISTLLSKNNLDSINNFSYRR